MYSVRLILLVAVASVFAASAHAQKSPIKWGDVPEHHLQMTSYEDDTTASYVILAEFAEVYYSLSGDLIMDYHRRIKILDEGGIESGTIIIPYRAENSASGIFRVRGMTHNRTDGGRVETARLSRRNVFHEDLGLSWKQVRFTLPQLKAGSMFEYSYRRQFDVPYLLPSWTFQHEEPTLHSEYRVTIPEVYEHVILTKGSASPQRLESKVVNLPIGSAQQQDG